MSAGAPTKLIGRLKRNRHVHALWRRVKTVAALLRWNLRVFSGLVTTGGFAGKRRLLVIYDFVSQPFSIGDVLVIQEASPCRYLRFRTWQLLANGLLNRIAYKVLWQIKRVFSRG